MWFLRLRGVTGLSAFTSHEEFKIGVGGGAAATGLTAHQFGLYKELQQTTPKPAFFQDFIHREHTPRAETASPTAGKPRPARTHPSNAVCRPRDSQSWRPSCPLSTGNHTSFSSYFFTRHASTHTSAVTDPWKPLEWQGKRSARWRSGQTPRTINMSLASMKRHWRLAAMQSHTAVSRLRSRHQVRCTRYARLP